MERVTASGTIPPELLARHRERSEAKQREMEEALLDLKPKINEILFQKLPPKTTLEDMEKLACKMWELVVEAWEKSDY